MILFGRLSTVRNFEQLYISSKFFLLTLNVASLHFCQKQVALSGQRTKILFRVCLVPNKSYFLLDLLFLFLWKLQQNLRVYIVIFVYKPCPKEWTKASLKKFQQVFVFRFLEHTNIRGKTLSEKLMNQRLLPCCKTSAKNHHDSSQVAFFGSSSYFVFQMLC